MKKTRFPSEDKLVKLEESNGSEKWNTCCRLLYECVLVWDGYNYKVKDTTWRFGDKCDLFDRLLTIYHLHANSYAACAMRHRITKVRITKAIQLISLLFAENSPT